jgi:hypothetical protein
VQIGGGIDFEVSSCSPGKDLFSSKRGLAFLRPHLWSCFSFGCHSSEQRETVASELLTCIVNSGRGYSVVPLS